MVLFRFHARRRPLTDLHDSILCQFSARACCFVSFFVCYFFSPSLDVSLALILCWPIRRFYDWDRFEFLKKTKQNSASIIDFIAAKWARVEFELLLRSPPKKNPII
jgi:hypothetical protein